MAGQLDQLLAILPESHPARIYHLASDTRRVGRPNIENNNQNRVIRMLIIPSNDEVKIINCGLFKAFAPFGNLREAKVIIDRGSGRSRGFGFVSFETVEDAEKARDGMNAKFLDGWVIFVDPAKPREAPPPRHAVY